MVLAFQAGLLNVGGLLACQTFVSHVTGFATLAALELESGRQAHGLGLLAMLVTFMLGSMVSGVLVDLRMKQNKKPKYYIVFGFLFALTLATAIGGFNNAFGRFGRSLADLSGYGLVVLLCFTCGLQNGTITLVSKSIVRTTHLTGLVTDLGIGIIRVLNRKTLQGVETEWMANLMRAGIVLFFFLGSLVGVPLFRAMEFRGFVFPCLISGVLFAMTLYFQVIRRQPQKG
ncbi:MAG TPA: YoaK family protein [Bdellovibrionales bacterium]|nr:YoaK family protein [Bdellovibrionales bacterium]